MNGKPCASPGIATCWEAIDWQKALAYVKKLAPTLGKDKVLVVTVSGRGDKDCAALARYQGEEIYE